ncbi:DUF2905 domain-containing protein [Natroniella sulfidigena]|uniref:DUF2905 domain-containing protein n=1 Tax=Natroniella sulfidigena TaxID=723921 RepID=UPI00200AF08F|nr:DUF2905 domain-containing protein [Natroniella sulfidigena]MCK8815964.1 DUF2905 domain-containing protein [Natroniella sulfidigena]
MRDGGGLLILLGVLLIVGGLIVRLGFPLGRLPGDIHIQRGNFSLYLPITTSILLSVILSLLFRLLK